MIRGRAEEVDSASKKSGRAVEGLGGRRTRMGPVSWVGSERKMAFRPIGSRRISSRRASFVSCWSARQIRLIA